MRSLGIEPSARTFTVLLKACVSLSLVDHVYGHILQYGHVCDVYVTGSLISMYSKYGLMDIANQVFEQSLNKNVVCSTTITCGDRSSCLLVEARVLFDSLPERNDVSCSAMVTG